MKKQTELKPNIGGAVSPPNGSPQRAASPSPKRLKGFPKELFSPFMTPKKAILLADMCAWWTYKYTDTKEIGRAFFRPLGHAAGIHKRCKQNISTDIQYLVDNGWIISYGILPIVDGIKKKWYKITYKTAIILDDFMKGKLIPVSKGNKLNNYDPIMTPLLPHYDPIMTPLLPRTKSIEHRVKSGEEHKTALPETLNLKIPQQLLDGIPDDRRAQVVMRVCMSWGKVGNRHRMNHQDFNKLGETLRSLWFGLKGTEWVCPNDVDWIRLLQAVVRSGDTIDSVFDKWYTFTTLRNDFYERMAYSPMYFLKDWSTIEVIVRLKLEPILEGVLTENWINIPENKVMYMGWVMTYGSNPAALLQKVKEHLSDKEMHPTLKQRINQEL